ncbi:MAG: FAD-dependent oxidoreductase [Actinomycetes bacterium]
MPPDVDQLVDTCHPRHAAAAEHLLKQYAAIPRGAPVRLAKRTSNLFRPREPQAGSGLDVAAFDQVLSVDPDARTADVQGMTTYEDLVDATLPYGLMPLVVPQLKTITLGGAVTGLGIESSSFRRGMPHESVLEMDVLTGDGRVVTAQPQGEHRELFYGFPNSYGTLGYALRLRIELEPTRPYVSLEHRRHGSLRSLVEDLVRVCATDADFVDAVVFAQDSAVVTVGRFADAAPYTSDYTKDAIYYRSLLARSHDYLTVRDYLWRWDTDWFWCSRGFGAQHPVLRRLWPRKYLRSNVYWQLAAAARRYRLTPRNTESVIQDVEVPAEQTEELLTFLLREIPIRPIWLCPIKQRRPDVVWELYSLDPHTLYVNAGFWSTMPRGVGEPDGLHNRNIELEVARLGGRKSLYSTAFYPEDEFWATYNGSSYDVLKKTYDPDNRLLDLYAKAVGRR